MSLDYDFKLALRMQKEFEAEDSRRKKTKSSANEVVVINQFSDDKLSLIDPTLEYIDPNPDIHALFLHFNNIFFWKKLLAVEVRWSPRMTSCAGICCYEGRGKMCSIRLSLPLLKLRPRKDLVETLLHEMIHAYLFVTNNNRDRDGHGPEFHKHMHRLNKAAGTKITVYHTFHDEVKSYQQHWWKCQGPCKNRPPYFGMVRRAMNRAPGPNDNWWADHKASCGGTYVKVREPEGYSTIKKGKGGKAAGGKGKAVPAMAGFPSITPLKNTSKGSGINGAGFPSITPLKNTSKGSGINGAEVKSTPKSGIYGYFLPSQGGSNERNLSSSTVGTLGKKVSSQVKTVTAGGGSNTSEVVKASTSKPFVPFFGKGQVLGGGDSVRSPNQRHGLVLGTNKVTTTGRKDAPKRSGSASGERSPAKRSRKVPILSPEKVNAPLFSFTSKDSGGPSSSQGQLVKCPVCNCTQGEATINEHLDECIASQHDTVDDDDVVCLSSDTSIAEGKGDSWFLECPGCRDRFVEDEFDNHLNHCQRINGSELRLNDSSDFGDIELSDSDSESPSCPICGISLSQSSLGAHLENCLSTLYFDEDDGWGG